MLGLYPEFKTITERAKTNDDIPMMCAVLKLLLNYTEYRRTWAETKRKKLRVTRKRRSK